MDLLHNFLQYLVPCNAVKIQVQKIDLLLNSLYPTCFTMLIPTFKTTPTASEASCCCCSRRSFRWKKCKKERKKVSSLKFEDSFKSDSYCLLLRFGYNICSASQGTFPPRPTYLKFKGHTDWIIQFPMHLPCADNL